MDPTLYFTIGGVFAVVCFVLAGVVPNREDDDDVFVLLLFAGVVLFVGWMFIFIICLLIGIPVAAGVGLVSLKRWLDSFEKEL